MSTQVFILATSFQVKVSAVKGLVTVARLGVHFLTKLTIPSSTDRSSRIFVGVGMSTTALIRSSSIRIDVVCRQYVSKIGHLFRALDGLRVGSVVWSAPNVSSAKRR